MNKKTINVNGFEVGSDNTYIIADIGSNHKQNLTLAKESIDAAAESGADAIKFQSINLNKMYFNPDKNTTDFVKKLEFPEDWHQILDEYPIISQNQLKLWEWISSYYLCSLGEVMRAALPSAFLLESETIIRKNTTKEADENTLLMMSF